MRGFLGRGAWRFLGKGKQGRVGESGARFLLFYSVFVALSLSLDLGSVFAIRLFFFLLFSLVAIFGSLTLLVLFFRLVCIAEEEEDHVTAFFSFFPPPLLSLTP